MSNGHMLLNKSHVKAYIKRRNPEIRPGWEFEYVANQVYLDLSNRVARIIDSSLRRHPSKGKTFRQIM